ncbi:hypothetical protein [Nocardia terpenica]|uniref:DUF4280 domain-containing protein n=1 Tax=Nocardia terpenica TaxID=455432 RepID=A0A291RJJ8_9NOCA|nr:hypothetical protein [Nocardia terpenica]ATL67470.1 hypothetical protein CRH09_15945 [Nocardia terpenica]
MAKVLVASARLSCGPVPPHGPITVTATAALTVDGNPVLVVADFARAVLACGVQPPSKPCTKLLPFTAGVSTVLTVGGQPVVLASAVAQTDATAANGGAFTVTAPGQTILDSK